MWAYSGFVRLTPTPDLKWRKADIVAAIAVPPLMGVIADATTLADSFLILGALMLGACGLLALAVRRAPKFKTL